MVIMLISTLILLHIYVGYYEEIILCTKHSMLMLVLTLTHIYTCSILKVMGLETVKQLYCALMIERVTFFALFTNYLRCFDVSPGQV